ncbi:hypothetical protein [Chitinophaga rhizosphaerae]|uniref:hypothetical protein n=1 Tax=Chitinophaga rhizosphaerae TaxID=1864947 RepID=UPI000F80F51E|nr:hypothetical protein [Chitinophaga rhizosphaerae]
MKKILFLLAAVAAPVLTMAQLSNKLDATGNIGIGTTTSLTHRINLFSTDPAQPSLFFLQHNGIPNSTMYIGTASNNHWVPNHNNANLLESHTNFHISTAGLNNNIFFETGRGAGEAAPVRMIITGNGRIGIGTSNPAAHMHISAPSNSQPLMITTSDHHYDSAYVRFLNGTSTPGQFLPTIRGRGLTGNRPLGFIVGGEIEDIVSSAEPHAAAVMAQGVSKAGTALVYGNVFSVINATTPMMIVKANGNVGIGTTNPGTNKLAVEGTIAARKVKVTQSSPWPDFVFKPEYKLPSLEDVVAHIRSKGHLPGIPTEAEIAKNGQDLGEMNAKLLQKVEELTLYLIDMTANNERLQRENDDIRRRLDNLEKK